MMLILSFIAVCVACFLLWQELQAYAPYPWWETKQAAPAATSLIPGDSGSLVAQFGHCFRA
jgi:hypothetical protein